jgi:hypothetical protein
VTGELGDHRAGGPGPVLVDVLVNGGEPDDWGQVVVVDADDGEVVGDAQPSVVGRVHRPERHLVGEAKIAVGAIVTVEQRHRCLVAALDREAAVGVEVGLPGEPVACERPLMTRLAEVRHHELEGVVELAADQPDPAMAELEQVVGADLTDRHVVDADRRHPVDHRADRDQREAP